MSHLGGFPTQLLFIMSQQLFLGCQYEKRAIITIFYRGDMKSTLSLTLLLTLTHTATSCSSFSINKCQFFFEGNKCAFSSCALSGGDGTNATLTSLNWTFCISSCCGHNDPSIATYYKPLSDSCASKSVQEDEQQYYLLGIGLGVVLFIIISLYCYGLDRIRQCFGKPQEQKMEIQAIHIEQIGKPQEDIGINHLLFEGNLLKNGNKTCCICLEEGTNIQACCGHEYHQHCIQQWYKRKHECPECRTQSRITSFTQQSIHCQDKSRTLRLSHLDITRSVL